MSTTNDSSFQILTWKDFDLSFKFLNKCKTDRMVETDNKAWNQELMSS